MSLDTATKRRSMFAMGLVALVVHPVPDNTIAAIDQKHFLGLMAAVATQTGLATTALHIFSTSVVEPNHVSDSGNNVLIKGDLETQGDIYTNNVFLPDDMAVIFGDSQSEANIFWFSNDTDLVINSSGGIVIEAITDIFLDSPDTRVGGVIDYVGIDADGILTFIGDSAVNGLFIRTTRIASSPYTPLRTDDDIFVDTDGGAITINLPAGIDGKRYRVINTGANAVTLNPNGAELLLGENSAWTLLAGDVLVITYNTTEGWY